MKRVGFIFIVFFSFFSSIVMVPVFAKTVFDQRNKCALSTTWDEITDIKWSGSCVDGKLDGEGIIDWYIGEKFEWRDYLGPIQSMIVSDGELKFNFTSDDFEIRCENKGSGYRKTEVFPKKNLPDTYFSGWWASSEILKYAGEYAREHCPDKLDYGNIAISVYPGPDGPKNREIITARNYSREKFDWLGSRAEYNNIHSRKMQNVVEKIRTDNQKLKRQIAKNIAMEKSKQAYELEKNKIDKKVEKLFIQKSGDLETLASALEKDLRKTLTLVSEGINLIGFSDEKISTRTIDGNLSYLISKTMLSEYETLLQSVRAQQDFNWENFLDSAMNSGRGKVRFTCVFSEIEKIPTSGVAVQAKLTDFQSDIITTMSMECR